MRTEEESWWKIKQAFMKFPTSGEKIEAFKYIAKVSQIEEPEFGCEGRPENQTIQAIVTIELEPSGKRISGHMPERLLYQSHLDDGVRVIQQGRARYLWDDIREKLYPVIPELTVWLKELGL